LVHRYDSATDSKRSRNEQTVLEYLIKDGRMTIALDDPITGPMCLAHDGQARGGR
jgi:hypothetical protein